MVEQKLFYLSLWMYMLTVINAISNVLESQHPLSPQSNQTDDYHQLFDMNQSYNNTPPSLTVDHKEIAFLSIKNYSHQFDAGLISTSDCEKVMEVADPSLKAACAVGGAAAGLGFATACAAATGGLGTPACIFAGLAVGGAAACGAVDFKKACQSNPDYAARVRHQEIMEKLTDILDGIKNLDRGVDAIKDDIFFGTISSHVRVIGSGSTQYKNMVSASNHVPVNPNVKANFVSTGAKLREQLGAIESFIEHGFHGRTLYERHSEFCTTPKTYNFLASVILEAGFLVAVYDKLTHPGYPADLRSFTTAMEANFKNYWKCAAVRIMMMGDYYEWLQDLSVKPSDRFSGIHSGGGPGDGHHVTTWFSGCGADGYRNGYDPQCRWQFVPSHIKGYYKIMAAGSDFGVHAWGGLYEGIHLRLWGGCNKDVAHESCLWKIVKSQNWNSGWGQDGLVKAWNIQGYNHRDRKNFWWTFPSLTQQRSRAQLTVSTLRNSPKNQNVEFPGYQMFLDGTYSLWD